MSLLRSKRSDQGQSAIELALLLPIMAVLIGIFLALHNQVTKAKRAGTRYHTAKIELYGHGQGFLIDPITGQRIPAGELNINLSNPELIDFGNMGQVGLETAASIAGNRLLDLIFNQMQFFQSSKILPDTIKGFSYSALNSYINSGFTEVDWEGAAWDGATAGLSSDDATEFFQGAQSGGRSVREFMGSGAQQAALSFTQSHGDEQALATGFVEGLFSSDSFGSWTTHGREDDGSLTERDGIESILVSAAAGAISSTATGLAHGEFDIQSVARATAMGTIQNNAMAELMTGSNYQGNPQGSMGYSAFSGVSSTLINGGSVSEAAFAGANRAFYSQQIQGGLQGSSIGKAGASIGFESAISLAQGNSIDTVGQSALASAVNYAQASIEQKIGGAAQSQIAQAVNNLTSSEDVQGHPDTITDAQLPDILGPNAQFMEQNLENNVVFALLKAALDKSQSNSGVGP